MERFFDSIANDHFFDVAKAICYYIRKDACREQVMYSVKMPLSPWG